MAFNQGFNSGNTGKKGGGASNVTGLTDTNISSPSNNQVLKYNSSTSTWVNAADVDTVVLGSVQTAATQAAQLALTTQQGDVVVRSDENKSYVHNGGSAGTMADFTLLATPTDAVLSVDSNTGAITAAQLKTSYESNADTNEFSDAEQTKLANVAASANNYTLPTSVVHDNESGALHSTDPLRISGNEVQLWKGNGFYDAVTVPDNNTTYSNATTSSSGLMSNTDKGKLDGVATSANNYTHPSGAGYKHIPTGGSSGQVLEYSSSGTAVWATPTGGGGGGQSTIGTNSGSTYADGELFVSATGIAYWKLNDGAEGWYEVGALLANAGSYKDSVSSGSYHTVIIKADGTVWSTGYNNVGQLGNGTSTSSTTFVSSGISAIAVSAGTSHTAVIKPDGTVWSVGRNNYGQLGNGTTTSSTTFVSSGISAIEVSCHNETTTVIKPDNTVWGAGQNNFGQIGDGTTTNRSTFVSSGISAIAVDGGSNHTIIIKPDNTVWSVGRNNTGQIGDGTTTDRSTFVSSGISAIAVAGGGSHSTIIKPDNTVWAVGSNWAGQLGDGTTFTRFTFVSSSGISAIAVDAGSDHTAIIKSDNTVWSAGYNGQGQMGDGTTTSRSTFVSSGISALAISSGLYQTIVIKSDDTVWGVGYNPFGNLGDGTSINRSTFVSSGISGLFEYGPRITDPVNFP
jgi:alpha-tubulin suppressor-like RCC1 family protein